MSASFLFVFFLLVLAERETLEPGVGALSDWLPALVGESSPGHVTLSSRLMAYTVLNKLNLLCRPLRGSGSQNVREKHSREHGSPERHW